LLIPSYSKRKAGWPFAVYLWKTYFDMIKQWKFVASLVVLISLICTRTCTELQNTSRHISWLPQHAQSCRWMPRHIFNYLSMRRAADECLVTFLITSASAELQINDLHHILYIVRSAWRKCLVTIFDYLNMRRAADKWSVTFLVYLSLCIAADKCIITFHDYHSVQIAADECLVTFLITSACAELQINASHHIYRAQSLKKRSRHIFWLP
jgi:hypothetical protein